MRCRNEDPSESVTSWVNVYGRFGRRRRVAVLVAVVENEVLDEGVDDGMIVRTDDAFGRRERMRFSIVT